MNVQVDRIEDALAALMAGRPVVVLDEPDRENEGDLVMAAQFATAEALAPFARYGSGLIYAPMTANRADELALPPMVDHSTDSYRTAFTVTVDARQGITTGISAADRALTARLLADPETTASDLARPGHVLPLRARPGGVLERPGHTEATIDLLRLAGLPQVGLIVELIEDDGSMRRAQSCRTLADQLGIPMITIADLQEHLRSTSQPLVARIGTASLPTRYGMFIAHSYRDATGAEHLALVAGEPGPRALVRVHSECLTGDVFGSLRCDCGPQLHESMDRVAREGGAVVHLQGHEGRGMGLAAKIAAYGLQDDGMDTVDANVALGYPVDSRNFRAASAILADLGYSQIRLLTNNPRKVAGLELGGTVVAEQIPLLVPVGETAEEYLRAKQDRMGHRLNLAGREAWL